MINWYTLDTSVCFQLLFREISGPVLQVFTNYLVDYLRYRSGPAFPGENYYFEIVTEHGDTNIILRLEGGAP